MKNRNLQNVKYCGFIHLPLRFKTLYNNLSLKILLIKKEISVWHQAIFLNEWCYNFYAVFPISAEVCVSAKEVGGKRVYLFK